MAVTDKLKGMVEELRHDLIEVKDQVKQLLPHGKSQTNIPVRQQHSDHPIMMLQRETNRVFDDFLRGSLSPFPTTLGEIGNHVAGVGWPCIDIDESDIEIRLQADLAGMDRKDIDVSVADGLLTIRGEKRMDDEEVGRHSFRRERFYGSFSRSLEIPAGVDLEKAAARMKNGVLQITMPKLRDHRSGGRRIPIGKDA